jgi:hypothetical protein
MDRMNLPISPDSGDRVAPMRGENPTSAFHRWLIKHRIYCERGNGGHLAPATQVIQQDGHDICVCDFHATTNEEQK